MKIDEVRDSIIEKIRNTQPIKRNLLVAIDGRAASGKTTLALSLKDSLSCNIIHMDHFFLRPEQRSQERMSRPGGNVDIERFTSEILSPLRQNMAFSYSPYDCSLQKMAEPIEIGQNPISIIEGSYSCHPELSRHYDLRIFLHIDKKRQMNRIIKRNGEAKSKDFESKWIPLEEAYFEAFNIYESCDLLFSL